MGSLAGAPARVSSNGAPTSCEPRFREARSLHGDWATEPRLFRDNDARMTNVLINVTYVNEGSIDERQCSVLENLCVWCWEALHMTNS